MAFADQLSDAERGRARKWAYGSALSGCISEVMIDSSAIIILFFNMLKASSQVMMLSTSISGIISLFLLIPCAGIVDKIGLKRSVQIACYTGFSGFILVALSPWFGTLAVPAALLGCMLFCLHRSLYGTAWYPLLDNFLKNGERGKFFAVLRTLYMSFTGGLFFALGFVIGDEPPFWLMQTIIGAAGIAILGRWFCIARFPVDPGLKKGEYDLKKALSISLRNGPLTGFSTYICLFSMATTSLLPLTLVYLRKGLGFAPGTVQILSSVGIGGTIFGYWLYGNLTRKSPLKYLELTVHLVMIAVATSLFLIPGKCAGYPVIVGALLFILSIAISWLNCNNSMEYMALGRPGNKTMAMAYCQTYNSLGVAAGRTGNSLLLGSAMLAPAWSMGGMNFTVYHALFLMMAVMAVICLVMLPILPSFIPEHEDYYNPAGKK